MKTIIIFSTLFLLGLTIIGEAQAGNAGDSNQVSPEAIQEFWRITNLRPGEYGLVSGEEQCQVGNLYVLPIEEHFTLMMGAHPIILGLGGDESESADRECSSRVTTSFGENHVESKRTMTCGNDLYEFTTKIDSTDKGFDYMRKNYLNGKIIRKETCELQRDED